MKTTEEVRKYAAEQGVSEEEALKRGMEEKSKQFVKTRTQSGNGDNFTTSWNRSDGQAFPSISCSSKSSVSATSFST